MIRFTNVCWYSLLSSTMDTKALIALNVGYNDRKTIIRIKFYKPLIKANSCMLSSPFITVVKQKTTSHEKEINPVR